MYLLLYSGSLYKSRQMLRTTYYKFKLTTNRFWNVNNNLIISIVHFALKYIIMYYKKKKMILVITFGSNSRLHCHFKCLNLWNKWYANSNTIAWEKNGELLLLFEFVLTIFFFFFRLHLLISLMEVHLFRNEGLKFEMKWITFLNEFIFILNFCINKNKIEWFFIVVLSACNLVKLLLHTLFSVLFTTLVDSVFMCLYQIKLLLVYIRSFHKVLNVHPCSNKKKNIWRTNFKIQLFQICLFFSLSFPF